MTDLRWTSFSDSFLCRMTIVKCTVQNASFITSTRGPLHVEPRLNHHPQSTPVLPPNGVLEVHIPIVLRKRLERNEEFNIIPLSRYSYVWLQPVPPIYFYSFLSSIPRIVKRIVFFRISMFITLQKNAAPNLIASKHSPVSRAHCINDCTCYQFHKSAHIRCTFFKF